MSSTSDPNALILLQGKTFRATFTVYNNAATPTAVSLAGYGATFTIYNRAGGTPLFTFTDQSTVDPVTNQPFLSGDAPVVVQPSSQTGVIAVRVGANITAQVARTGAYEVCAYKTTDPTEVQSIASGPLYVLPPGADTSELSNYV
jgi:hypothetical protein